MCAATFCIILFWIISKTVPLYKKVQIRLDELNELVSQNLSGIRVIRAFARSKLRPNVLTKPQMI